MVVVEDYSQGDLFDGKPVGTVYVGDAAVDEHQWEPVCDVPGEVLGVASNGLR